MSTAKHGKTQSTATYALTLSAICIAANIVLGMVTSALGIPLYLDTLGTFVSAIILGPLAGAAVGALSNILTGLMFSMTDIPFFIVNMVVGIVVGLIAKKFKWTLVTAVITGLLLSAICPIVGTPIGIFVYGGLNGSLSDVLVMSLVQGGQSIFEASFVRNIASNFVDKIGTAVICWAILKSMPAALLGRFGYVKPAPKSGAALAEGADA